jgi:hypothetical protein
MYFIKPSDDLPDGFFMYKKNHRMSGGFVFLRNRRVSQAVQHVEQHAGGNR